MPRLLWAKKDVVSCEKLRGSANMNWSAGVRMGEPGWLKASHMFTWANAGNWNILVPAGKERKIDSLSSGERKGNSPNLCCFGNAGVVGLRYFIWIGSGTNWKIGSKRVIIPYTQRSRWTAVSWVRRDTRNPVWICGDHPVRLNTNRRPIVNQYCEGKVKSTPNRGVK